MSEPNDPPPSDSPFPESSLTPSEPPPPHGDPVQPDAPAPQEPATPPQESPPPPPHGDPVAPEPPAPSTSWMEPAAGPEPWSATEAPGAPPSALPTEGGLVGGDPLLGATPPASAFPAGYTSPPPPGAGGDYGPPPTSPFGETQAPFAGQYVLAGWWRRVGAAIIDGVLILIVALIIMTPLGIGLFSSGEDSGGFFAFVAGLLLAGLVIAIVALAYAPVMMGKTNGKTIGRMATGIRVVRADGKPITIGFAALREVAVKTLLIGTVGGSLTFGLASLIDVLWPLWDDENRALHDFVVNTRTVMDAPGATGL